MADGVSTQLDPAPEAAGTAALPPLTPVLGRAPGDVLRIAHRSLELLGPDPAVACAGVRSAGAHLVEVDARVTGDGALVVAHDPWVRVDGARQWIADLPARVVLEADHTVLPLAAALTSIRRHGLGLYLDIKSIDPPSAQWLAGALMDVGLADSSVLASSRSDAVALCAQAAPEIPRAVLFASDTEDPVQLAHAVQADFVHPCWERFDAPHEFLTDAWVDRVRDRGLGIITWHEERAHVLTALVARGVDGICTDDMALLTATASQPSGPGRDAGAAASASRSTPA
jgi:glycerophosphoryl diester phosphodiesterase